MLKKKKKNEYQVAVCVCVWGGGGGGQEQVINVNKRCIKMSDLEGKKMAQRCSRSKAIRHRQQQEQPQQHH